MRTHFSKFFFGLVLFFLASCQKDKTSEGFVDPLVRNVLQVTLGREMPGDHLSWQRIWSEDINGYVGRNLWWDSRNEIYFNNLVMVSIGQNNFSFLQNFGTVLFYLPSQGLKPGYVLLDINDQQKWDDLAAWTHDQRGCGQLERLTLNQTTTTDAALAPYLDTQIHSPVIQDSLAQIDSNALTSVIDTLSSYTSRFHRHSEGLTSSDYVASLWQKYAGATGGQVSRVEHSATPQKSIVAAFPGYEDNATTVIVGAHLDSINSKGSALAAPGADDDASGIAVLSEIIRLISTNKWQFARRVEIHGYAAEEVGLIGSQDLAASYRASGRKVAGMMQLDMTGFSGSDNGRIFLVSTDTNAIQRRHLKDLMALYLSNNYEELPLAAGTSDHRSWCNQGFPCVFPFEDPRSYNTALHTTSDTKDLLQASLAKRFASLALAYIHHLAGVSTAVTKTSAPELVAGFKKNLAKIFLAVRDQDSGQQILAATSQDVASVEVCPSGDSSGSFCAAAPEVLTLQKEENSRHFFATTTIQLQSGSLYRITGYSSAGKVIEQRLTKISRQ